MLFDTSDWQSHLHRLRLREACCKVPVRYITHIFNRLYSRVRNTLDIWTQLNVEQRQGSPKATLIPFIVIILDNESQYE